MRQGNGRLYDSGQFEYVPQNVYANNQLEISS